MIHCPHMDQIALSKLLVRDGSFSFTLNLNRVARQLHKLSYGHLLPVGPENMVLSLSICVVSYCHVPIS